MSDSNTYKKDWTPEAILKIEDDLHEIMLKLRELRHLIATAPEGKVHITFDSVTHHVSQLKQQLSKGKGKAEADITRQETAQAKK